MRYETSYILFLYREMHFPKADSRSLPETRQRLSFASIVLFSNSFPPLFLNILSESFLQLFLWLIFRQPRPNSLTYTLRIVPIVCSKNFAVLFYTAVYILSNTFIYL